MNICFQLVLQGIYYSLILSNIFALYAFIRKVEKARERHMRDKDLELGLEAVLDARALQTRPFNLIFNNLLG